MSAQRSLEKGSMLRGAIVVLGTAVVLSLLLPMRDWLKDGPVDRFAMAAPGLDLALACVLLAAVPALLLFRVEEIGARIPSSWGVWLLAFFSLLFVAAHLESVYGLSLAYAHGKVSGAQAFGWASQYLRVWDAVEDVAKGGAILSLLAVLAQLRPPRRSA
jgi:hypothetical protein